MFASQDMFKVDEVEEEWSASDDETQDSPVVPQQSMVQAFVNPTMGMGSELSPSISQETPTTSPSVYAPVMSMNSSMGQPFPEQPSVAIGQPVSMGQQYHPPPGPLANNTAQFNEQPVPMARPSTGVAFKDRMSRMEELQERKRAERTAASDLVSKSSGLASSTAAISNPGVGFTKAPSHNEPKPVSQTELNIQARGMDMVFDPTVREGSRNHSHDQEEEDDDNQLAVVPEYRHSTDMVRKFITNPFTGNGIVQCQITRHKSMLFNSFPSYELYLKDGMRFVMAARKRKKTKGAYYIMSTDKKEISRHDENFIGKCRSNILGTQFSIFDNGTSGDSPIKSGSGALKKELGFVTYESNIMGAKGPRKMTCVLPSVDCDGESALFTQNDRLEAAWTDHQPDKVNLLVNRAPKWSERVAAYTLDFKGRVTMASVKNFQLVENQDDDRIMLQFGKVGVDEFTMDFRAPLSPLQALGICLSSLDNKWACE